MQQFEINNYAKKQVIEYLNNQQITIDDAMSNETHNAQVAEILHQNLPTMVRKIYALPKFQKFFWEKRELLTQYVINRLTQADKAKKR